MRPEQQRIYQAIRQLCREHVQDCQSAASRHRRAGRSEIEIARHHRTITKRYLIKMAVYQQYCDHAFGNWLPAKSQDKGLGTHQYEERLCRICLKMEARPNDLAASANDGCYALSIKKMVVRDLLKRSYRW